MRSREAWVAAMVLACTPSSAPPPTDTQPTATPSATAQPAAPARANVDVRLELEQGPDPDYGAGETSVRGILVIPALSVNRKLFAVPFPYFCRRGVSDAGDDLVIECLGDDGMGYARLRAEPGRIVVVSRDYGRLEARRTEDAIALPPGATATIYAPPKLPAAH